MFSTRALRWLILTSLIVAPFVFLSSQDSAMGSMDGTVFDPNGGRIVEASVAIVNTATAMRYSTTTDAEGRFALNLLPPGDYSARVEAQGMSPEITPQLNIDVGGAAEMEFHLKLAGAQETLTISAAPLLVETSPAQSPRSSMSAR